VTCFVRSDSQEELVSLCRNCNTSPVPPGNRIYCSQCSPLAAKIWKASQPRLSAAEFRRSGGTGEPPYLDYWESRAAYQAYYREYMRAWRRRKKNHGNGSSNVEVPR
jgi:hypothetical protein